MTRSSLRIDREAPPATVDHVRGHVVRAVQRLCPQGLAGERDDIIQNTLVRLHQSGTLAGSKPLILASYVWKTVYSVLIDEIRRRQRRPSASIDDAPVALTLVQPGPSPEQIAAGRELGARIRRALNELPESRRAVVVLYLQGHTVHEIAGLLGWTTKRAENLVYRGLASLRTRLDAQGLHPGGSDTIRATWPTGPRLPQPRTSRRGASSPAPSSGCVLGG